MTFEFMSNSGNFITVDAPDEQSARTAAMRKKYGRVIIGGVSYEPPRGAGLHLKTRTSQEESQL